MWRRTGLVGGEPAASLPLAATATPLLYARGAGAPRRRRCGAQAGVGTVAVRLYPPTPPPRRLPTFLLLLFCLCFPSGATSRPTQPRACRRRGRRPRGGIIERGGGHCNGPGAPPLRGAAPPAFSVSLPPRSLSPHATPPPPNPGCLLPLPRPGCRRAASCVAGAGGRMHFLTAIPPPQGRRGGGLLLPPPPPLRRCTREGTSPGAVLCTLRRIRHLRCGRCLARRGSRFCTVKGVGGES